MWRKNETTFNQLYQANDYYQTRNKGYSLKVSASPCPENQPKPPQRMFAIANEWVWGKIIFTLSPTLPVRLVILQAIHGNFSPKLPLIMSGKNFEAAFSISGRLSWSPRLPANSAIMWTLSSRLLSPKMLGFLGWAFWWAGRHLPAESFYIICCQFLVLSVLKLTLKEEWKSSSPSFDILWHGITPCPYLRRNIMKARNLRRIQT